MLEITRVDLFQPQYNELPSMFDVTGTAADISTNQCEHSNDLSLQRGANMAL